MVAAIGDVQVAEGVDSHSGRGVEQRARSGPGHRNPGRIAAGEVPPLYPVVVVVGDVYVFRRVQSYPGRIVELVGSRTGGGGAGHSYPASCAHVPPLHSAVRVVGDVHGAGCVDRQTVGDVHLIGEPSDSVSARHDIACCATCRSRREPQHSVVLLVAHIESADGVEGDKTGLIELVGGCAKKTGTGHRDT